MRILAGTYKGRKLLSPPKHSETRPMTGSVRKSLFGMLAEGLTGAVVADLYCGTGTLGLEALSRGAKRVYFAERDNAVVERLRRNIEAVGAVEKCVIWHGDIEARIAGRLARLDAPVDIAFVDPPYAQVRRWSWEHIAARLFAPLAACMSADGVAVLRADSKTAIPDSLGGLAKVRTKIYGDMAVVMLTKVSESE